jgi:transposase InsO family protein
VHQATRAEPGVHHAAYTTTERDERFFRPLNEECIWQQNFKTFEQAKAAIEVWVSFYNTKRLHQALNYRSPAQHLAKQQLPKVA